MNIQLNLTEAQITLLREGIDELPLSKYASLIGAILPQLPLTDPAPPSDIVTSQVWPGMYQAVDRDTYDGAPDSKNRHQVGLGATPEQAVADLMEEIEMDRS